MKLNIATIVPRTEAEGPGVRFALWVQGCPMRCSGCCNPDFLLDKVRTLREPEDVVRDIGDDVEGVSLLGGEPFAQAEGLAVFARLVRASGRSVMVYTGYTLEELEELKKKNDPHVEALLSQTDILVDGRYEKDKRSLNRRWIGSDNQRLHFLTDRYKPSDSCFSERNTVEIRVKDGKITVNGWPAHGAGKMW